MAEKGVVLKPYFKEVSVLFSGGSDSTLAAALMLSDFEKVTLLTFDPGFIFFVENSRHHVKFLKNTYGEERVEHLVVPTPEIHEKVLFGRMVRDVKRYGFNLNSLVCLGCRLAMHTAAVIHNLERGVPYLADGSIRKQAQVPEQMESVIERNRLLYEKEYGIRQYSPIYEEGRSDRVIEKMGITNRKNLKRQFILFDTQPTCPFGVPADVYSRLFYGLFGNSREVDSEQYCRERYPLMRRIVEEHFTSRDKDLAALVRRNVKALEKDDKRRAQS